MNQQVVNVSLEEASLKRKIRRHLRKIGFQKNSDGTLLIDGDDKDAVLCFVRANKLKEIGWQF